MIKEELYTIVNKWLLVGMHLEEAIAKKDLKVFIALSEGLKIDYKLTKKRLEHLISESFQTNLDLFMEVVEIETTIDSIMNRINNITNNTIE